MNAFSMFSCAVAVLLGAVSVVAQDQEGWRLVPGAGPGARQLAAVAYDTVRQVAVLFGGVDGSGAPLADTWEFDGRQWAQRTTAHVPPARLGHGMAYDPGRGRVVMFGGGSTGYLADTWEYDGSDWHLQSPQASPAPRYGTAMAFDRNLGRTVLFGGLHTNSVADSEMWAYDGWTWSLVSNGAIPARRHHAMCWSQRQNAVMVVGGLNTAQVRLGDTGYYLGNAGWNYFANITARTGSAICENPVTNLLVLTGGSLLPSVPTIVSDNLMYGDSHPAYSPRSTLPEALSYHVTWFDERRQQVVVFGGLGPSGVSDRTYAYCANDTIQTFATQQFSALSTEDVVDVAIGHFDGNGRRDVVALSAADDRLTVLTNPGTTIFDCTLQATWTVALVPGSAAVSVAFGELGLGVGEDVVIACPGRNQVDVVSGPGSPTVQSFGVGSLLLPVHALAGDLDGTATGEVVVACRGSLTSRGGVAVVHDLGSWTQTITNPAFARVERVALADLDGDGDLDVAALGRGAADGVWLLANSNGTLVDAGFVALPSSDAATDLVVGDADRDGDADFVVSSSSLFPPLDNRLVFVRNDQAAPLAPASFTTASLPLKVGFTTRLSAGHRDGSLRIPQLDIALVDALTATGQMVGFVTETGFGTARNLLSNCVGHAVFGDLNGDGCDDFVTAVAGGGLQVDWVRAPARMRSYGVGCEGSYGLRPTADTLRWPTSGYSNFRLTQAYPQTAGVLLVDLAPGQLTIGGGCTLWLANPILLDYDLTDASGTVLRFVGFPSTVAGYDVFAQWAVLDPNGSFQNLLALSNGVQVQLGL